MVAATAVSTSLASERIPLSSPSVYVLPTEVLTNLLDVYSAVSTRQQASAISLTWSSANDRPGRPSLSAIGMWCV
jgi:hypothetical protein